MILLRDYQRDLIDALRGEFRGGRRRVLAQLPTGGGKTVIFSYLAGSFRERGRRCLIVVHRQELLAQTSATLARFGVPHGVVAAGSAPSPGELVQVCMAQTLARRLDATAPPHWLVFDEAHHAVSATYAKVLEAFPGAWTMGFTATPERLDGKGLGDVFDALVEGPSVAWLQERGHLARVKYYAPPVVADLAGVGVSRGDYAKGGLAAAMSKADVIGDCVAHYRRLSPGLPAVAFCVTVEHARLVAERFNAAGIPAATLDGTLHPEDRARAVEEFAAGKTKVLTSCEIISEGFDLPAVTTAILLRKTKSLALHLQQIGRVLRPHPGKEHAVILDHVGNLLTHGCAEDERRWSLEGRAATGRRDSSGEKSGWTQCPVCYAMTRRSPRCPECGTERKPEPKTRKEIEAELQEYSRLPKLTGREFREELNRLETLEELKAFARRQGYHWRWALHRFNERRAAA